MPSIMRVHKKWASILNLPGSPKVDRIIDALNSKRSSKTETDIHDKGRVSKIIPLNREANIWIMEKSGIEIMYEYLEREYGKPLPYDIVKTAALHHLLDAMEKHCRDLGVDEAVSKTGEELLGKAYETLLRNIEKQLRYALNKDINHILEFAKALKEVYNSIRQYSEEVKQDIIAGLIEKKPSSINYRAILDTLKKIITHGIIEVNGNSLPLLPASRKIQSELTKGNQVTITLTTRKGRIKIKASTLKQLMEKLSSINS